MDGPNVEYEVNPDHECSICLTIFYEPLRLSKCGHTLCKPCVEKIVKSQNISCPICRKPFSLEEAIPNKQLVEELKLWYPLQVAERQKKMGSQKQVFLRIGNLARKVNMPGSSQTFYDWMLYVDQQDGRTLSEYAHSIQVKLHPSFNPPVVKFRGDELVRVRRVGWGVFNIEITIHWKDQFQGFSKLDHMLSWAPHKYKFFTVKL